MTNDDACEETGIARHGAMDDRPLRILVVDDSRLQRRILMSSLQGLSFELAEAGDAEEALAYCRETLPDIVLSDWMMPGMTGIELCGAVRELSAAQYVYFIVLTSKSEKGELAHALREGADDFLSKPVSAEELLGRIAAGRRLLDVERQLTEKNRLVTETLEKMRALHAALDRDLIEARKLQMSLVPRTTVRHQAGTVSFLLQPSGHVGGDLVGSFPTGPSRIGVFSLDVSGHGIASALLTARLSSWLTGNTPDQNIALRWDGPEIAMRPPHEICEKMNDMFIAEIDTVHYFTMAIGEIDLQTGRGQMCQAGHPHPLIQRADGEIDFIGEGGMPIGLINSAEFQTFEFDLAPGDRLLLYSDGLTECPTDDGVMLEEEGLAEFMRRYRHEVGDRLLHALKWELSALVNDADLPDDLSGLLVEYAGSSPSPDLTSPEEHS
ncbi:PP2C family protein-serine/threonine phosphatase [Palleronia aestuarii]|nr:fused response regulator/phosphatase [Palleronia aestuarii]